MSNAELLLGSPVIIAIIAWVGKVIDRKAEKRAQQNAADHAFVRTELEKLNANVTEHRDEFHQYRKEHAQAHELINRQLESH